MTHRSPFFALALCLSLSSVLAGCPTDAAPADTGRVDGGPVDAPRDTPPRLDTPAAPDALDAQVAANAAFVPVACRCIGMRGTVTEAECIANSVPDAPFAACARLAFNATEAALTAYTECITDTITARQACYEASDCSMAMTDACDMAADTAVMDCRPLITDTAAATLYDTTNATCIEDTIIGSSVGSCLAAGAAVSTVGMSVFDGSTILGGDHTLATRSCVPAAAAGGADRAHRWRAPMAGVYRIDSIGSDFDTVVYAREGCDLMTLGCNDDIEAGVNTASEFEITVAADQEVVIIVDGFGQAARGNYVVNITYVGMADAGPGGGDAGPVDAGVGMDAGMDAGVATDGGTDAGSDAGSDAGPGTDAGPPAVEVLDCTGLTTVATIDAATGAYVFTPASPTVNAGEIVRFVPGSSIHDMTSGTGFVPDGRFQTMLGVTQCLRFNVAGTYPFYCGVHGFMGSITIAP